MKTYWVSLYLEISSKDDLKKYGESAIPIIKRFGGKPLVRGGKYQSFSGPKIIRTVIWEFPSYERALLCHESEDYKKAWAFAKDSTKRTMFIVEGVPSE
mgnify:CR=1 FL=1|tara:strand:+ start:280 stop:576 length:297 start_codon:yes stop_codon:yes gene_type:complete